MTCGVCGIEDNTTRMLCIEKCLNQITSCAELSIAYIRQTSNNNSQYATDVKKRLN